MNRFPGGSWLVGAGVLVVAQACAPTSSEVGRMKDPDAGIGDGGEMSGTPNPSGSGGSGGGNSAGSGGGGAGVCKQGEAKPAGDGCNTCTCDASGQWACTEIGCACKPGETRTGADGCVCTCENGNWACKAGCEAECSPGATRINGEGCTCTCATDGTWQCPAAGTACGTACDEGTMKPAGDGCNTCQCFHGSWACTLVACAAPIECDAGLGDCDGDPMNFCETKLAYDPLNCGGCGIVCDFPGGTGTCTDGKCSLTACSSGWADCNLDASDGCEAPVGPKGCSARCDYPADAPEIVAAKANCECPTGMTCVRNTVPDKGDFCYPTPDGCGTRAPDCRCLGVCACSSNAGATCSEQMSIGGFVLDCNGLQ